VIAEAELALDTDAKLAASMKKAGNVLVPSVFSLGEPQGNPDKPLPAYALKSAIDEKNGFSYPAVKWPAADRVDRHGGGRHRPPEPVPGRRRRRAPGAAAGQLLRQRRAVDGAAGLAQEPEPGLRPTSSSTGESVQIGKLRVKTDESH
jgi:hypothetical protein